MESNSSYGTSWADQWDYNPDPVPADTRKSGGGGGDGGGGGGGVKKKVSEGLGKTKAVASTGAKKVKEGTVVGFQWIKDKYHKKTQKR